MPRDKLSWVLMKRKRPNHQRRILLNRLPPTASLTLEPDLETRMNTMRKSCISSPILMTYPCRSIWKWNLPVEASCPLQRYDEPLDTCPAYPHHLLEQQELAAPITRPTTH
jgi:hypothetical protein